MNISFRQLAGTGLCVVTGWLYVASLAWSGGLDTNGDGMSDAWQQAYGVTSSEAHDDSDGDGEDNFREAQTGTDPNDATSNSRLAIKPMLDGPLLLEWQGVDRKRYQIQAADPGSMIWNDVSPAIVGEGETIEHLCPAPKNVEFFRLQALEDSDVDADTLYGWEEALIGSDDETSDTDNDGIADALDSAPMEHKLGIGLPVMSRDLNVKGAGWTFNTGSDAPEGAYLTKMGAGVTSRSAVIDLGSTLAPGKYFVFVKVIDYGKHNRIDIRLGGGTGSVVTDDRDSNRYWTESVPITVKSATDTITLKFVKLKSASTATRLLLRGLLISPDPDITVQTEDVAVKLALPTKDDHDNSRAVSGNLLENSSFEVGVGHGWGFTSGDWPENRRNLTIRDAHDPTVAFHGDASIKLPLSGQAGAITLISKPYKFKPNKEYTVSAYVRSTRGNREVTFGFYNIYDPPPGFPRLKAKDFTTTQLSQTTWKRISFKTRILEYPTSDYQIKFRSFGSGFLWIDAIQIEEGDLSPYVPKTHIEVGIDTEAPSHILHEGDPLKLLLHTYRDRPESLGRSSEFTLENGIRRGYVTGDLTFRADWWNRRRSEGEFTVNGTQFGLGSDVATDVAALRSGVAVDDDAVGKGYIMYSDESVHTRFSANAPHRSNSDHFIAVRNEGPQQGGGSQWEYNDNSKWVGFIPRPSDTLVATAGFDTDDVTSLAGTSGNVNGIRSGYVSGDLTFRADWWGGRSNDGEFTVDGTQFFQSSGDEIDVTPINRGVAVDDDAVGTGYIMYSQENVHTRFSSNPPRDLNSEHFIGVQYDGKRWNYNTNLKWVDFVPRLSDVLVAAVDFSSDTIRSLQSDDPGPGPDPIPDPDSIPDPDPDPGSTARRAGYEIYDHLNRVVASGTIPVSDSVGKSTATVSLPSQRGHFRCHAWVIGEDGTEDELTYALVPPPKKPGKIIAAVNAGGPRYVARDGTVFSADTGFSGGGKSTTRDRIVETMDDVLYQSERNGRFSYQLPVANGTYFVKLYLAEISKKGARQRQFDLSVEGSKVVSDLDLYAKVGHDKAHFVEVKTRVRDGRLNVTVNEDIGQAKISAIKVTTLGDRFNTVNALLGCHTHHTDFALEAMQRLGFRWNRGSSPISWFRWSAIESTEGAFKWRDEFVDRAADYDVSIMGTLGVGVPAWAKRTYVELKNLTGSGFVVGEKVTGGGASGDVTVVLKGSAPTGNALQLRGAGKFSSGAVIVGSRSGTRATIRSTPSTGTPDLRKWETFIEKVVRHYDGKIFHWEIFNEPDKDVAIPNAKFYAELLKRAAKKIHGVSEQQRVVGVGGVGSYHWIESAVNLLGPSWESVMDFSSAHVYPGNSGRAKAIRNKVITPFGLPVWNTEAGRFCLGSFAGVNANFVAPGEAFFGPVDSDRFYDGLIEDAGKVGRNFISTIGYGFSKLFYYDGRFRSTQDNLDTEPTMFEYNDSIKMKGITLGILANFFDYSVGVEDVILSDNKVKAFLFQRGETALAGLYTEDSTKSKVLDLSRDLSRGDLKVYEYMGNEITLDRVEIELSKSPTVVVGQGLTVGELRTALLNARVSNGVDTTAPNLVITVGPRGPRSEKNLQLRWLAMDEISRPTVADPLAIEFRYQLKGVDANWINWSATTYREYKNVPVGRYVFQVQARDAAGNVSPIVTRDVQIVR